MPMRPAKRPLPGDREADRVEAWRAYCDALFEEGVALGPGRHGDMTLHIKNGMPITTQWNVKAESPRWVTSDRS